MDLTSKELKMNQSIINNVENGKSHINAILAFFVGNLVGIIILKNNPIFLLILFSLPLGLLVFIAPPVGFYIILFSVFFSDWFMQLGLIPPQMTLFPEVILIILTIKVAVLRMIDKKFIRTPFDIPLLLFILWGLLSTLVNSQSIVHTIIGFRFDLKFVLMFFLIVNLNLGARFFKQMLRVFIILLLVQVPVALVKFAIYGQGESAIGTYAYSTGTESTILPLIAISIFAGFYFFEKPRLRYILFSLLFVIFSIIGGKRAFVFFGILLFFFIFWQVGRKNIGKFSLMAPFLMLGFLASVYFIPTLHSTFENPYHLIDYSVGYSTQYSTVSGKAVGRASAIKESYSTLKKSPFNSLLGFGPGSMAKTFLRGYEGKLLSSVSIEYGRSQWVITSLESGYVGTFLFIWLFSALLKTNKRFFNATNDRYWKSIAFGFKGIWFTYLMGFFYCAIFRTDILAFIFWFFASAIFSLEKQGNIY